MLFYLTKKDLAMY